MKRQIFFLVAACVAALLSSASAANAAAIMADGTYEYTLSQNGSATATSTVTVKRSGNAISIHEDQTVADPSVGPVRASADQTVAAATLSPLSFAAAYTSSGKTQDVRLSLNGPTGAFIHNGERLTVPVRLLPGTQAMAIEDTTLVMSFLVVPALAEAQHVNSFTIANPTGASTFVSTVDPAVPSKPSSVPAGDVGFSIASPIAFTVWLEPRTSLVHEIDVPAQNLIISLTKHS